ncbi:flagellar biosynthesis protein FlhB [Aliidongia dinghuensis]|uniref:Flagellar biosynthetic protein FlhB n=1 Tax=Aliidongia dinghuensis TaxID=1867774 RepID=A0A8J3E3T4_9PROT|nr:flagellar biosynthesis protein FlhB [Aliidongia dinghuensis]GGF21424.1 flagellar biosynthesis protein FlhB [Aliidongia dinghuensis]
MAEDQDSRTEDPTGKRVSQARGRGQVAMSKDATMLVILLASTVTCYSILPMTMRPVLMLMRRFIEQPERITVDVEPSFETLLSEIAAALAWALLPPFLLMITAAVVASIAQTGFIWATDKFDFNLNFLNPFNGLGKIFSMRQLVEFGKGLIKAAIVGTVAFTYVSPELAKIETLTGMEPIAMTQELMHLLLHLMIGVLLAIAAIALFDYFYQKWSTLQQLKMTKQEVKDEHKNAEGDPHIKGRMRQIRMSRARKRMMAAVPKASVVITNPTHYSVALQYEMGTAGAPKVVAKGVDFLARKIREIATEHDVPIIENPPVARALYATVEIDEEIPPEHYKAVAEIIGYVMKLKRFKRAS